MFSKFQISLLVATVAVVTCVVITAPALDANYTNLKAAEKQSKLQQLNVASKYDPNQLTFESTVSFIAKALNILSGAWGALAFTRQSDELPAGRMKILHPYGVCGTGEWKITADSGYTGLFSKGSNLAVTRLSHAAHPKIGSFIAGLAIKTLF